MKTKPPPYQLRILHSVLIQHKPAKVDENHRRRAHLSGREERKRIRMENILEARKSVKKGTGGACYLTEPRLRLSRVYLFEYTLGHVGPDRRDVSAVRR